MQKVWKSTKNCKSYSQKESGTFLSRHGVDMQSSMVLCSRQWVTIIQHFVVYMYVKLLSGVG